jgi:hypothetical protein
MHKKCYFTSIKINPLVPRVSLVDEQFDAEKTKHPHKLSIYTVMSSYLNLTTLQSTLGIVILASEGNIFLYLFYFMTPCMLYVGTTVLEECTFPSSECS